MMHIMKILIMSVAILALVMFSVFYSYPDAHLFAWIPSAWIPSEWIEFTQTTVVFLSILSVIAYATIYIYYACKYTDKHASK
jgi:hypothetical protein